MYNVKCRAAFSLAAVAMVLLLPGAAAFAAGTGAYSQELVGGIADVLRCTVPCGPALCIVRPCTAHASANGTALGANVQRAGEDIPALVTEGVTFFVSIIVFYFFVGTAASFVEAQWGATTGSPGKAGSHLADKIGQLALAVVLALLVYPLVNWITGVLLEFL